MTWDPFARISIPALLNQLGQVAVQCNDKSIVSTHLKTKITYSKGGKAFGLGYFLLDWFVFKFSERFEENQSSSGAFSSPD